MLPLTLVEDPAGFHPVFLQAIHSESRIIGWLTYGHDEPPMTAQEEKELNSSDLLPGFRTHRRLQRPYFLICTAYWASAEEHGVCYRALDKSKSNSSPEWFRPLHTLDGKGWLDPEPDGGPRFTQDLPQPR